MKVKEEEDEAEKKKDDVDEALSDSLDLEDLSGSEDLNKEDDYLKINSKSTN